MARRRERLRMWKVEGERGIDGAESQSQLDREKGTGTGRGSPGWRRAAWGVQREQAER